MRATIRLARGSLAIVAGLVLAADVTPAAAGKARSSNAGSVSGTVTVNDGSSLCLLVQGTKVDFGEVELSDPAGQGTFAQGDVPTVLTNCSGADVVLTAKGSKAVAEDGTTDWSLLGSFDNPCAAGFDLYNYFLLITDPPTEGGLPLTEAHQALPGVRSDGQQTTVTHGLVTPCEGSGGNGQTMRMNVQFLAVQP